jgi:hypothetical protein
MRRLAKGQMLSLVLGAALVMSGVPSWAETQGKFPTRVAKSVRTLPQPAFDWFANGKAKAGAIDAEAVARTKAAIRQARALGAGASWVCSPAGSGRTSVCYKG